MSQNNIKKTNRLDLTAPQAGSMGYSFDENGKPVIRFFDQWNINDVFSDAELTRSR